MCIYMSHTWKWSYGGKDESTWWEWRGLREWSLGEEVSAAWKYEEEERREGEFLTLYKKIKKKKSKKKPKRETCSLPCHDVASRFPFARVLLPILLLHVSFLFHFFLFHCISFMWLFLFLLREKILNGIEIFQSSFEVHFGYS